MSARERMHAGRSIDTAHHAGMDAASLASCPISVEHS